MRWTGSGLEYGGAVRTGHRLMATDNPSPVWILSLYGLLRLSNAIDYSATQLPTHPVDTQWRRRGGRSSKPAFVRNSAVRLPVGRPNL
jgi:hypothetical protein